MIGEITPGHLEKSQIDQHVMQIELLRGKYRIACELADNALKENPDIRSGLLYLSTAISASNYAKLVDLQNQYLEEALILIKTLGEISRIDNYEVLRNRMVLHNTIGQVYHWKNELDLLKEQLDQALECAKKIERKKFISTISNNLWIYYDINGDSE